MNLFAACCRDPAFHWCVSGCAGGSGCVALPLGTAPMDADCRAACPLQRQHPPSLPVRLLRWSCRDDCRCARDPHIAPRACSSARYSGNR